MDRPRVLQGSDSGTALLVCCVVEIVFIFSGAVGSMPWIRLLENAVCRQHMTVTTTNDNSDLAWSSGSRWSLDQTSHTTSLNGQNQWPADETRCKGNDVQADVAELLGALGSFASIPALFLIIPYSILAKHVDRRVLLVVNMTSIFCGSLFFIAIAMIPGINLKLLWLGSVFDLIGGGSPLLLTLIRSIIAENVEADQLSSVLYNLSGLTVAARLFGVVFGAWLLRFGVITANLCSSALGIIVIPVLGLLPRCTARVPKTAQSRRPPQRNMIKNSGTPSSAEQNDSAVSLTGIHGQRDMGQATEEYRPDPNHSRQFSRASSHNSSLSEIIQKLTQLPVHNPLCFKFLAIMFVNSMAMDVRGQVRTWASKRYEWSLATVGYILSGESVISVIILFGLPRLDQVFPRRLIGRIESTAPAPTVPKKRRQELQTAHASIGLGAAGALILALATNRVFFVFGLVIMSGAIGFVDAVRAFCTSYFAKDEVQPLYAAVTAVETLGLTIGSPVWGWIFAHAYRGGSVWIGIPFGICAVLLLCTLGLMLRVKHP